ncbi:hypothetical protein CHI02_23315 [Niallia circulans]|uniref:hypothetical protein n=1 Tax=Niallia circulans TaxID=1397 RepID=UPI000BA6A17B|nr:hypothetical protein [Niallia circulans]PAE09795.1 hypothetical protein CHI02_23315 [Niallia circulans]
MNNIPKIEFFTKARLEEFWGYVWMLMSTASPGLMLVIAVISVGMLLSIVIVGFKKSSKDTEDEEEDYEIRHY